MAFLNGKKVLLGISGGIAAYKGIEVLRRLQMEGAEVRVMMTDAAQKFISPLTFEVLSRHQVYTDLFKEGGDPEVVHVALGNWPDLILIVPATANLMAKMANGLAEDLVTSTLLVARAPVLLAPAMETQMFQHPAVQRNLKRLQETGYQVFGPDTGKLASGAVGLGRLVVPEQIVTAAKMAVGQTGVFAGRRFLVTAGRTEEDIDPVRFITNRSTGKMGYAVAQQAKLRGSDVILVSGPSNLEVPPGIEVRNVRTVDEMKDATIEKFDWADALIMTAAVLDFKPKHPSASKIKKETCELTLDLTLTEDFLIGLGKRKGNRVVVGFAMETENGVLNAKKKLEKKNLDLIVLNNLNVEGAGFGVDTNVVTFIDRFGKTTSLPKILKEELANRILDWIGEQWEN